MTEKPAVTPGLYDACLRQGEMIKMLRNALRDASGYLEDYATTLDETASKVGKLVVIQSRPSDADLKRCAEIMREKADAIRLALKESANV